MSLPIVQELDVDALPRGTRINLLVDLIHGPAGEPQRLPLIVLRGERPGPVLGISAAVHGNELNGIPVIHGLIDRVDPARLRGTLVAAPVVNRAAFERAERSGLEGVDLNHCFPGKPNGSSGEVIAHRLIERVFRHVDVHLDLHTASAGRASSLYVRADMTRRDTADLAYIHRPQIIVHNPPNDGTLRGALDNLGVPAITVEIGDPSRFQSEFVQRCVGGARGVMAHLGMLPRRQRAPGEAPVLCARSYWMHTDHGGLLEVFPSVASVVRRGEPIARIRDVFGDITAEYQAPEDAVIVGRAVNPAAWTGSRLAHLGVVADPGDPRFVHPKGWVAAIPAVRAGFGLVED